MSDKVREALIEAIKEKLKDNERILAVVESGDGFEGYEVLEDGEVMGFDYADGISGSLESMDTEVLSAIHNHGQVEGDEFYDDFCEDLGL